MSDIQIGTRVYNSLYGGRCGTIVEVSGQPDAESVRSLGGGAVVMGGSCCLDVVFDDGSVAKRVPEGIVRGVQWDLIDEPVLDKEAVQDILARAEAFAEQKESDRNAAKQRFEDDVARHLNDPQYDHLFRAQDQEPRLNPTTLAAKNIRLVLKRLHPKVKFSVRKRSSNCIDVAWPADAENVELDFVSDILADFKVGYYDLESDCHLSRNSPFNVVYGGVEFIFCQPQP